MCIPFLRYNKNMFTRFSLATLWLLAGLACTPTPAAATPTADPPSSPVVIASAPVPITDDPILLTANPTAFSKILIKRQPVWVEVAITPEQHRKGLMNRKSLPDHQGMIFVFNPPRIVTFWMKDTFIPLSIAFVDETNKIIDMQDMDPQSETYHVSPAKAKYAIEVNQGWFRKHKIEIGSQVVIDKNDKLLFPKPN